MNKYLRVSSIAATTMLAISMPLGSASAQEKLRVADSFPVGHAFVESGTKFWMQEVTRLTNNAVQFEYFPAEQLGKAKDLLSLTQTGVVDVGYVMPAYVSDKMPLSAVAELPGGPSTSCQATLAYFKLAREGGILHNREFAPNGIRVMFAMALPPYQAFMAKQKIDSVKSFEGLKVRTAGGAMDSIVQKLKAVSVRMSAPEIYESLSRGTIDGLLFPTDAMISYKLIDTVKFGTIGEDFGRTVRTYVISEARWKKLSPGVQKAMMEAGEAATRRACSMGDNDVKTDLEKIRAKGITLVQLPQSDRKELDTKMTAIAIDWAQTLDKRGKPGTDVLNAYKAALQQAQ
jgi:TRAP-type C4-dicarboxylate transport system substrate-binding protein